MHLKHYLTALSFVPAVFGQNYSRPQQSADPFKVFTLTADNITAKFIPYGARLTSLLVPDRDGNTQDVIVGYDDPRQYLNDTETSHTYFGAVIGRIANRIKNGTFTLDGTEYHIPKNQGLYTLHGGTVAYDQRNWTVAAYTPSSVTFTLYDAATEGFPGDVVTHATFTVDSHQGLPRLTTKLVSLALTETTPIMLSNHIYWNLNGFKQPTVLNDTWVQLPLSERFISTDSIQVPDGSISTVADSDHQSMDFTTGKIIGQDMQYTEGLCGADCVGYDNCFIIDRDPLYSAAADAMVPALRMNSSTTGISMEVATNQPAVQFFTCLNMDGSIPVKASQVERNRKDGTDAAEFVDKYGCVAIEPEGWIDGVNNPQWGQESKLFYSPESRPAVNLATYTFGTVN
ncbi:galactose mutarotase-like protein [Aspergillus sclerotiicarbonarius CBS 121057]|uniref:Galactose mutarotase-like protein n=1 Tax=Aspergillus sclerotiicarbonarius (strain CBS 121057 / IBT 28362) TaxID=1448318 RepID=A0A319DV14_ASPSB|nr:galactose mutarotase-like protein [Aspergillus sclerotiicarbonarius CBS 121057]